MQTKPFRIGTRGSPLALAQAHEARDRLMAAHGLPEEMFEIVVLTTKGDRITDRSLAEIGGKGLFTQELEEKLAIGELDFAVHSAKDMEADGQIKDSEKKRLRKLLKEQYGLDGKQLDAVIAAGLEAESSAVDYYRFTSDLKRHLNTEQRLELIGILWDIVYADGERSEMEDHVIWRIADLLGVSSRERIQKRQEAAARVTDVRVAQDDSD